MWSKIDTKYVKTFPTVDQTLTLPAMFMQLWQQAGNSCYKIISELPSCFSTWQAVHVNFPCGKLVTSIILTSHECRINPHSPCCSHRRAGRTFLFETSKEFDNNQCQMFDEAVTYKILTLIFGANRTESKISWQLLTVVPDSLDNLVTLPQDKLTECFTCNCTDDSVQVNAISNWNVSLFKQNIRLKNSWFGGLGIQFGAGFVSTPLYIKNLNIVTNEIQKLCSDAALVLGG